jgi:Zn-dependent protease with chaperone function
MDAEALFDVDAALAAVRGELPWWAPLAPLAYVAYAGLAALIGTHLAVTLALLGNRGVTAEMHWTERARRAWAARTLASGAPLLGAVLLGIAGGSLVGPISIAPGGVVGLLAGIAAFVAAYPQIGRVERIVRGRSISLRERVAGQAFAFLALFPHVLIVLIGGALMPAEAVPAIAVGALLFAALLGVAMGAGLRACVALGLAYPADARLQSIVDACAEKVGVRAKRVWLVRWPTVNALAFPRTGELAYTEEAAAKLTDEELAGVTAHELGHLGEPRSVVLARSVALFALYPIALIRPIVHAFDDASLVRGATVALALVLVGFALALVAQRIARRMEERADAVAHAHEEDPGAYARALERIYELNLVPAVLRAKRPVHPHLYDRLTGAGLTPEYPRPAPPPRAASLVGTLALVAALSGAIMAWSIGLVVAEGDGRSVLAVALRGAPADDLAALGEARWRAGDLEGAAPFYRAAAALRDDDPYWAVELARIDAAIGACDEAGVAFEVAMERAWERGESDLYAAMLEEAAMQLEECR